MIKFYSDNLVEQAISITPSSENKQFPVSNLKHPFRTKVFRSTDFESSVVFDFGETSKIDSICIVDEIRNGFGFSTAKLELNGTASFDAPAFSIDLDMNIKQGFAFAEFPIQEYRFARIVLTSTLNYCELSNIFIGKAITFDEIDVNYGWAFKDEDLSTVKRNEYGQKFIDERLFQKERDLPFSAINKDELEQFQSLVRAKGLRKPFFMRMGDNSMIDDIDMIGGCFYLSSIPKNANGSYGLYSFSLSLEEAV